MTDQPKKSRLRVLTRKGRVWVGDKWRTRVNYFSSTASRRAWSRRPPRSPKPKISGFGCFLFLHPRGQGPTPLAALAKRIEASRSESGGVSCSFPYAFSDAFCSRFLRSMAYPRLFFTRWSVGSPYASMDGCRDGNGYLNI